MQESALAAQTPNWKIDWNDWRNGVLCQSQHYFSHLTLTVHICMHFLGFMSTRLGLGSKVFLPEETPKTTPLDLVRPAPTQSYTLSLTHVGPNWVEKYLDSITQGPTNHRNTTETPKYPNFLLLTSDFWQKHDRFVIFACVFPDAYISTTNVIGMFIFLSWCFKLTINAI